MSELVELSVGPYTVRGVSVGGVYTSLQIPEWDLVLDAGVALRSFAGSDRIFLSHGHADHASGLVSLLGIRRLIGKKAPEVFLPKEIAVPFAASLKSLEAVHQCDLSIKPVALGPGDEHWLGGRRFVRAFRTHHGVPSLGYLFFERVQKLKPEFAALPAEEIGRRRREGEEGLFEERERYEIAYATDTLSDVLTTAPEVMRARLLILECTFVSDRRTVEETRERGHTHLEEIAEHQGRFENDAVVLMHFSQSYAPEEVRAAVAEKLPGLAGRVHVFAPQSGKWFG